MEKFRAGWCNASWQRTPWSWAASGFMWWGKRFERPVIHVHRWSFSVWIAKLGNPLGKQGSVCWQAVGQIKPDIQWTEVSCPGLESPAPAFPHDFKTGLQLQGLIGAKLCECVVSVSAAPWSQTLMIPCSCWVFLGSLQLSSSSVVLWLLGTAEWIWKFSSLGLQSCKWGCSWPTGRVWAFFVIAGGEWEAGLSWRGNKTWNCRQEIANWCQWSWRILGQASNDRSTVNIKWTKPPFSSTSIEDRTAFGSKISQVVFLEDQNWGRMAYSWQSFHFMLFHCTLGSWNF